ncbi:hypothetical protein E3N88_34223 [Mikania micrantha]|uniref:Protein FLX-like 1 n=1 Tax=Mikania micrantha TaxID=192012 RepID=A0A5N6M068_9ASTR|nr:hypothetical protein E3N88_34223 [Mikania micrantha]
MSGRNHGPPIPMKAAPHGGMPPIHEPPFARNPGPMPHPVFLEEMREAQFARGHRPLPPHPAIIEEQLAAQHQDIQGLLVDNQRLAATHVALKQELEAAQHELQQTDHFARNLLMEKDMQMRELYEKSAKMEHDLRGVEGMRAELMQLHADTRELTATNQKLASQVQAMTQDLSRANADLQQVPALKSEIGGLRQELQHARAIKRQTVSNAKHYLKAPVLHFNGHCGCTGYNTNYGNMEANYGGNPYPPSYSMASANQMNPYGAGAGAGPGPATWGSYDMPWAQ